MKQAITTLLFLTLILGNSNFVLAKNENAENKKEDRTERQEEKEEEREDREEEREERKEEKQEMPDFEIKAVREKTENEGEEDKLENRIRTEATEIKVTPQGKTVKVKTTSRYGNEDEMDSEFEIEIETESSSESGKFKVKSKGVGTFIEQEKFSAKTNYPVSVNSETNELTISTPSGTRVVTILPDAAIANMLRRGVLDNVESEATDSATPTPEATNSGDIDETPEATDSDAPISDESSIELKVDDSDNPIYLIRGKKEKRLLGVFPMQVEKEVVVSAETGELISDEPVNLFNQFLDWLSTQTN